MGGDWLRQKTGRRLTSTNVGLIRCHLMYYCQSFCKTARLSVFMLQKKEDAQMCFALQAAAAMTIFPPFMLYNQADLR